MMQRRIVPRLLPLIVSLAFSLMATVSFADPPILDLGALTSPILFRGDKTTAYRDPAVLYANGTFLMIISYVTIDPDGKVYDRLASSKSQDLIHWSPVNPFTPKDQSLNFSSPGNIVRFGNEWVLCAQTYPRPHGERFGNANSRIWIMRSTDLEHWGPPELLKVKGPDVSQEEEGRMIDPFLLQDKDDPGKWWCFYKQHGISMSWSRDLQTWTFAGNTPAGENPCVIVDNGEYVLSHSPGTGIGIKRSTDLKTWRDEGILKLGVKDWPWAQGRLTAGFLLDLRKDPRVGKILLFFHGSDYPENDPRGGFDNFASIGVAWSSDLKSWSWPGKE